MPRRGGAWSTAVLMVALAVASLAASPGSAGESPLPDPAAVVPCPGITASSPQTLSTTSPPDVEPKCPGVVAGSYLGGSSQDWATDVQVDALGNSYVVGWTFSTDFPTTPDAFDRTYDGGDAFLAKFDPRGTLVYSTLLGGISYDYANSIVLDVWGNTYVTGGTFSSDFPTTPDAIDRTYHGPGEDVFVAKFSPTWALLYSTLLGGATYYDVAWSIAVDASGNAYITGTTNSAFPTTPGGMLANLGGPNLFVAKLNPNGTALVYSMVIGGKEYEDGNSIVVDAAGNAYVGGITWSADFPTTPGAFDAVLDGASDGYLLKLNPDATDIVYSTFLGGLDHDVVNDLAVDSDGNLHATGVTWSIDFPTTPGAADPTWNGGSDIFLTTVDASGGLASSTLLGGPRVFSAASDINDEEGYAVELDESGQIYLAGYTSAPDFPTSAGAYDRTFNGNRDAFVAKLDSTGSTFVYSTFLGGGDEVLFEGWGYQLHTTCDNRICGDIGYSLAVDPTGNVTVVGATSSADFPTTDPSDHATYYGDIDAFVIRIELIPEPNRRPVAYFDAWASSAGDRRVFVDASNSADAEDADDLLAVRWDWEADGTWDTEWSSTKTASHDYRAPGIYSIHLEVRDTGGLFGSVGQTVTVVGPPEALAVQVYATPTSGMAPLTVSFWVAVTGGFYPYTYAWAFGDGGSSSSTSPIHVYQNPGTYDASLVVTDSQGNQTSGIVSVTALGPLTAEIAADRTNGTFPLTVSFQATGAGGSPPYSFRWDFGDGTTDVSPDPIHTFEMPGTYTVTLIVTDANERSTTRMMEIVVVPRAASDVSGEIEPSWWLYAAVIAAAGGVASLVIARWRRIRR